ncbi:hypothetical protein D918_01171 [Trichuris suis]|nr:hypothetical protein D918_01171 [Trichuris suis]
MMSYVRLEVGFFKLWQKADEKAAHSQGLVRRLSKPFQTGYCTFVTSIEQSFVLATSAQTRYSRRYYQRMRLPCTLDDHLELPQFLKITMTKMHVSLLAKEGAVVQCWFLLCDCAFCLHSVR